jgi:hypothetical protein
MSTRNRVWRAQAKILREHAYELRRENDEHDLDELPWWRQRTVGNLIIALIQRYL